MTIESLGWFGTVFIFGLGAFATLVGFALLWARDAEGRRSISVGIGLFSFGILCVSWSTGVLERMSPDTALTLVSVTMGMFFLSVLWNLRGMPRGYPTFECSDFPTHVITALRHARGCPAPIQPESYAHGSVRRVHDSLDSVR